LQSPAWQAGLFFLYVVQRKSLRYVTPLNQQATAVAFPKPRAYFRAHGKREGHTRREAGPQNHSS